MDKKRRGWRPSDHPLRFLSGLFILDRSYLVSNLGKWNQTRRGSVGISKKCRFPLDWGRIPRLDLVGSKTGPREKWWWFEPTTCTSIRCVSQQTHVELGPPAVVPPTCVPPRSTTLHNPTSTLNRLLPSLDLWMGSPSAVPGCSSTLDSLGLSTIHGWYRKVAETTAVVLVRHPSILPSPTNRFARTPHGHDVSVFGITHDHHQREPAGCWILLSTSSISSCSPASVLSHVPGVFVFLDR